MPSLSYRELLDAAKAVPAGDTHAAARWVLDLEGFLKGDYPVQPSERSYLYRLRRVWKRRAAGLDARWNDYGSQPGNKPRKWPIASQAPTVPAAVPVWTPPLRNAIPPGPVASVPSAPEAPKSGISSLLEKYGKP